MNGVTENTAVKVIDIGSTYDFYGTFICRNLPRQFVHFHPGKCPSMTHPFHVIYVGKHHAFNRSLCIIKDDITGEVFVMPEHAIKII